MNKDFEIRMNETVDTYINNDQPTNAIKYLTGVIAALLIRVDELEKRATKNEEE